MSKSQKLRTSFLLFVLARLALFKFTTASNDPAQRKPHDSVRGEIADSRAARGPTDATGDHGIGRDVWLAPQSDWLRRERELAKQTFAADGIDLLIVPVQGDKNAFDPIERSLITRLISQSVADETEFAVANPSAVIRFLGTHRSQYPASEVAELARVTRAERVLILHAEHDRNGSWSLTATAHDRDIGAALESRSWQDLHYSSDNPPVMALAAIIDQVAEFASGSESTVSATRARFDPDEFQFPESFEKLSIRSQESPLHSAAYLQLVAMLHPGGAFNEVRNQLFERSYVELAKVSPQSDFYPYFKARALAYLGRRTAAARVLGEPANEYEKALLAALNGNLPDLKTFAETAGTSPLDFMVIKDMRVVEWNYHFDMNNDYVEKFATDNLVWAPFIYRSLMDVNSQKEWADYSAITAKAGLESLLPVEGDSVEAYFEAKAVTGDYPDEVDLVRLLWRHIDAITNEEQLHQAGKSKYHTQLSQLDIAELAKTIAVANHLQEIVEDLDMRDIPEAALAKIAEFEPIFAGHPEVTLHKGRALEEQSDDASGAEMQNLKRAATEARLSGFSWSGSMSPSAVEVAREYGLLLRQISVPINQQRSTLFSQYSRRYYEWPKGQAWFREFPSQEVGEDLMLDCLDASWTSFGCLAWLAQHESASSTDPESAREDRLARYSNRFAGHPRRARFDVQLARLSDNKDAELRLLQELVDAQSDDWRVYEELGLLHKWRGHYEAAQEVWLSYPGFRRDDGRDAVSISHYANYVSSQLYWIGQHELATPLLQISAQSGTGSSGAMSSAERLALINGDLETAQRWSADRVRRYRDQAGARDLMQLLHITGESDIAWSVFDQIQQQEREPRPEIWSGALVGHRMASADMNMLASWIEESDSRKEAVLKAQNRRGAIDLAPRYLLLAGIMDRPPNPKLHAIVEESHFTTRPRYKSHDVMYRNDAGELHPRHTANVYNSTLPIYHDPLLPNPANERLLEDGAEVDFRYTMLARSMTAFLSEDFKKSYEVFNHAAYFYFLDEYLPYFAFSAATLGRQKNLVDAIEARRAKYERSQRHERIGQLNDKELGAFFNEYLALAVLAAFEEKHEDAIRYLRLALNDRPFLKNRTIYPMYEIVDLADRLYDKSGNQQYREIALELSRRHTVVLPMYAWAYFVVAKHGEARAERVKAAASGLKLDPLSARGQQLPQALLDEANKLLEKSGPPYLRRTEDDLPLAT